MPTLSVRVKFSEVLTFLMFSPGIVVYKFKRMSGQVRASLQMRKRDRSAATLTSKYASHAPSCPLYAAAQDQFLKSRRRKMDFDYCCIDSMVACTSSAPVGGAVNRLADKDRCVEFLKQLLQWKLTRGQFRPGMLQTVLKNNTSDDIAAAVEVALKGMERFQIRQPSLLQSLYQQWKGVPNAEVVTVVSVRSLVQQWVDGVREVSRRLKGVGPATASLMLSLPRMKPTEAQNNEQYHFEMNLLRAPFFGDELAAELLNKKQLVYTMAEYEAYCEAVAADWIKSMGEEGSTMTCPADLVHATWAATFLESKK